MPAALRTLLSAMIDYAGLFPPASLPMEQAIRNYARYRAEPEAWMLGRFVCPAVQLAELSPLVDELFSTGPPLAVAVLETKFTSYAEYLQTQRADETAIRSFLRRHRDRAKVAVRDQRYAGPFDDTEVRASLPNRTAAPTTSDVRHLSRVYYELDLGPSWRKKFADLIAPFAEIRRHSRNAIGSEGSEFSAAPVGFKMRCGGSSAAEFPSPEDVAFALITCRDAGIPFKATAGLHHPIRKYHDEVKTTMHGFLNVMGGGVLAHACHLTQTQILDILRDEVPKNFVFDDVSFQWKNHRANIKQITAARQMVTSFGSCSFDEPREDLRALGLLP